MTKKRLWLPAMIVILSCGALLAQEFSITIDAQKDAWYDGLTGPGDGYIFIPSRAFTDATSNPPGGDEDVSAFVWLAWDSTYFYFYGEVSDDILAVNAQEWANDAVEVKYDPDPTTVDASPGTAGSVAAVRMSAFGEDNATCPGTVCWDNLNTGCVTGAFGCELDSVVAVTEADYARRETDNGYAVEFRVDWRNITAEGRTVHVGVGSTFGMAININDNDSNTRETQVQWSAGVQDAAWNDVRLHGTVEFLANNQLKLIATNSSATSVQECPFAVNDSAGVWYTPPTPGSGTTGDFAIAIDAEKDTWYDGLIGPDEGYVFIPARAQSGFEPATDDTDLSSFFWLAWDSTYFYLYGEITDDIVSVNSAVGSWENDGIDIRFDGDPRIADETPGNPGSVAGVGITAWGDGDPRATGATNSMGGWNVTTEDYARKDLANGYAVEFRLPWDQINTEGRTVDVSIASIFGLGMAIHDNDSDRREHQIQWSAVTDDASWRDTQLLGTVEFLADNKLKLIAVNSAECPPAEFVTNDSADVWYNPANVTSVKLFDDNRPETFSLNQNYPNPFNPETKIQYALRTAEMVTIAIYNLNGQLVRNLVSNQQQTPGTHEVVWDGKNDKGELAASGVYLYRFSTPSLVETKKMVLIK